MDSYKDLKISSEERDSRGTILWSTEVAEPLTMGLELPTSMMGELSVSWKVY